MEKRYLGDGVYAEFDSAALAVILTTEDGISVTNRIVLEPEVLDALGTFAKAAIYERQRPTTAIACDGIGTREELKAAVQLLDARAHAGDGDTAALEAGAVQHPARDWWRPVRQTPFEELSPAPAADLSIEVVKPAGAGPTIFPCGCSHLKVKAGLCSIYAADGTERSE